MNTEAIVTGATENAEPTPPPAVLETKVQSSITEYERQQRELQRQIEQLEENYRQQKDIAVATMNQLAGAIQALKILIQPEQIRTAE